MKLLSSLSIFLSLFLSFNAFADGKMKHNHGGTEMQEHEEHMKCMEKTGKSMEECMKMMEQDKGKSKKEEKTKSK